MKRLFFMVVEFFAGVAVLTFIILFPVSMVSIITWFFGL